MFQVVSPPPKTQLRRLKIKDYIPDKNDKELRRYLNDWRQKTSVDAYGALFVKHAGYSNIMTDHLLDRICDAAHHNLIASVDDLYKETRWHLIDKHGQTIVDKIRDTIPAPLPPSKTTTVRRCSQCGQTGHNSELFAALPSYPRFGNLKSQDVRSIAQNIPRLAGLRP